MRQEKMAEKAVDRKECIKSKRRNSQGYGIIKLKKETYLAHRISWVLHNGRIPKGMCICHKCDNPPCINPKHLFIGTNQDNIADAVKKNRMHRWHGERRGEKNPKALLKAKDIPVIKRLLASKLQQERIGARFGVSHVTINNIKSGSTWRHLRK